METGEKSDFEKKKNDISDKNKGNNKPSQKPNWFVCFFKVLAYHFFGGFINLFTGKNRENRFLRFINNIFILIMKSLPVALFVSYFLITLPTWIFVLAVLMMAYDLVLIVNLTKKIYRDGSKKQPKEEPKNNQEQAKNHAKFYVYDHKFYKNKPTTLIGDFFRFIGDMYFSGFFGKSLMSQMKIKRKYRLMFVIQNILTIIFNLCFWSLIVSCFLITVPTWLFVLAIVAAATRFFALLFIAHINRQIARKDIFFCKCPGEGQCHALFHQVEEEYQLDHVPDVPCLYNTDGIIRPCPHIYDKTLLDEVIKEINQKLRDARE